MKWTLLVFLTLSLVGATAARADFDRTYKAAFKSLNEKMCGISQSGTKMMFHECAGNAASLTLGFSTSAKATECTLFAKSVAQNAAVGGKKCSSLKIVAPGNGPNEWVGAKCTCTP